VVRHHPISNLSRAPEVLRPTDASAGRRGRGRAHVEAVPLQREGPARTLNRMSSLPTLSLALNVALLVPVVGSLLIDAAWVSSAYGPRTGARGIVLAVYVAILVASVSLLLHPEPAAITALLGVQVSYKLLTPITVGTLRNPVVLSNLGIAAVHLLSLRALRG
jgi:hypothetical protein